MISKNTKKGSIVYYNNNKATLSTILPGDIALIVVEVLPIDDDGIIRGTCQGCLIGDSDNKISCTCDDYLGIYEEILYQQKVTKFAVTVPICMLYEKPFAMVKADEFEEEIREKINRVKKELEQEKQELKETLALNATIKSNIFRLKEIEQTLSEI
jgi:hypothetical protein